MENKNENILTKDGLDKLRAEHKKLVEIDRPQVIEEIKEARNQGDLSENAEFDAAREKQGQIEDRITEIEQILQTAKIVNSKSVSNKVRIGSTVEIKNLSTNKTNKYTIVGSLETDPLNGKISNLSPVAKAIMDNEKGQVVTVSTNKKYDVKIMNIKN